MTEHKVLKQSLKLKWAEPPVPKEKRQLRFSVMPYPEVLAMRNRYKDKNALVPTKIFPEDHLTLLEDDPIFSRLEGYKYTNFTMEPTTIHFMKSVFDMFKPTHVLELGSGISTSILANHMKEIHKDKETPLRYVSVDHNSDYLADTEKTLKQSNVDDVVRLVQMDVCAYAVNDGADSYHCYDFDEKKLHDAFDGVKPNLVIIDGPIQGGKDLGWRGARMLTAPLCKPYCARESLVFLDDAYRDAELLAVKHWQKDYGLHVIGIKAVGKGLFVGLFS